MSARWQNRKAWTLLPTIITPVPQPFTHNSHGKKWESATEKWGDLPSSHTVGPWVRVGGGIRNPSLIPMVSIATDPPPPGDEERLIF